MGVGRGNIPEEYGGLGCQEARRPEETRFFLERQEAGSLEIQETWRGRKPGEARSLERQEAWRGRKPGEAEDLEREVVWRGRRPG